MGAISQEEINIDLFDEVQRQRQELIKLKKENELVNADKSVLQAKWEGQGLMIQKLHEENKAMKQYISNGIELGYIDDKEGDYKKFI